MSGNYEPVHLDDMLSVLGSGWEETRKGNERVFRKPHPHDERVTLWVYSSISVGQRISRGCAKDAIRIVAICHNWPIIRDTRTYRVPGWADRLQAKLQEVERVEHPVRECDQCGDGFLVVRKARRGPNKNKAFMGCCNYPRCRKTESIR